MKRVARGDPRAARVLAHRLSGPIERLVQRLVGDSEVSPAVTVRALVEILHSAGSYRGATSVQAWADDIAARTALLRVRERPRRWFELGRRGAVARRAIAASVDLADCLAGLSGPEREVLVLRYTLGASLERIEQLTRSDRASVEGHLRSGRGALRRQIWDRSRSAGPASPGRRRWAERMDRAALGEPISAEDRSWCEREAASQPLCRAELALFDELARRDAAPSPQGRVLVDAALAQLAVKVEKADQDEVTRIKHNSRAARLWWGAATLAGAALFMLLYAGAPDVPHDVSLPLWPASRVQLMYAAGDVLIDGVAATPAAMQLAEGSTLEIKQGSACVSFDPAGALCGGPHTRVRFSQAHGLWRRLDLETGRIVVRLPPQRGGARMSVVAGGVWATSQGATFSMQDDLEGVRSSVHDGTLEIGVEGAPPLDLRAHQLASIHDGATQIHVLPAADAAAELELLTPAELWHKPITSTLEVRGVPLNAEIWLDERVVARSELLARIPPGVHNLQVRAGETALTSLTFTAEFDKLTALSIDRQPQP
jgi:DNA-directed RNA polymerase specialized sigma24 family protein